MSLSLNGAHGANMCFGKAGLAAGTTSTLTVGNQTDFCIGGKMYRKAAASNAASPTTDATSGNAFTALAASQACVFVVGLDSSGALKVAQGPIAAFTDTTAGSTALQLPRLPDTATAIGYFVAQATSSLASSWTFGTGNNSSVTGLTLTFQDIAMLPPAAVTTA